MKYSDMPCDANIAEIGGGPYYRVKLKWLPHKGDRISLKPLMKDEPAAIEYEVVDIIHELHGVTERDTPGAHFVTVMVRKV